jgi:hypothetical protein
LLSKIHNQGRTKTMQKKKEKKKEKKKIFQDGFIQAQ